VTKPTREGSEFITQKNWKITNEKKKMQKSLETIRLDVLYCVSILFCVLNILPSSFSFRLVLSSWSY
jgi:hypothetical protein